MRKSPFRLLQILTKSHLPRPHLAPLTRILPHPNPNPNPNFRPLHTIPAVASFSSTAAAGDGAGAGGVDERSVGVEILQAAELIDSTPAADPAEALILAVKSLNILEKIDGAGSLSVSKALRVIGSVSRKLKRCDDSLESLSTADQILSGLFGDCGAPSEASEIIGMSADVQLEIAKTKAAMGRRRDGIVNMRRFVELKCKILDGESKEMGDVYKEFAEACVAVLEYGEALKVCKMVLRIYKKELGDGAREVAEIRRMLVVVYSGLGDNEAALAENEIARTVLRGLGLEEELLDAEMEAGNILVTLGRLNDAVNILRGVGTRTKKESEERAFVMISMAKALCGLENFSDAKTCLEISCGILRKMELVSPEKVAGAYADISMLYESMTEFEIALTLMKRTLSMIEKLPHERHLEGSVSARVGWLLLQTGRVPQCVPYLENAVQRLKESFGPNHFGVGFVYKHLGQAYLETDQLQSAVKVLVLARDIICCSFGPLHEETIDSFQCLANAYGVLGSYALAMKSQKQVLDALERRGPNNSDEIREAERLLYQLESKARGSRSAVFPANSLPASLQK